MEHFKYPRELVFHGHFSGLKFQRQMREVVLVD